MKWYYMFGLIPLSLPILNSQYFFEDIRARIVVLLLGAALLLFQIICLIITLRDIGWMGKRK